MDSKETIYWILAGVVLLGILFWFAQSRSVPPSQEPPPEPDMQEELYLRALQWGRNASAYRYAYMETIDSFVVSTALVSDGSNRQVDIVLPFAQEKIFFVGNTTLLCLISRGSERCAEVQNVSEMETFLKVVNGLFFKPLTIDQTVAHHRRLIDRGVITFTGAPLERTIPEGQCTQINFHYDITRLTLADISALNVAPGSLGSYDGQWCIGSGGEVYDKTFSYISGSRERQTSFRLLEADWEYADRVVLPPYESNRSTVDLFFTFTGYQQELQSCYLKEEEVRDRCISSFAVNRNFVDICDLAGSRRDRCYISLALYQQNEALCLPIQESETKDSCYIEVAGKTQRPDLCPQLQNSSRLDFCINVSTTPPANETGPSISDEDILNIFGG